MTVKVNAVVPALPSFCTALVAAMARVVASSFRMVPVADATLRLPAPDGVAVLEDVRAKGGGKKSPDTRSPRPRGA